MQPSTFLAALALGINLATGAPMVSEVDATGNPGSIYLCNGANWTGICKYIEHSLLAGGCTPVEATFNHALSIGGDDGPSCTVYSLTGCKGSALDVTYPGTADADEISGWPGTVGSFTCHFMFDPPK